MAVLSYDQKKALAVYERFFGSKYETNNEATGNTSVHVQTQKMCYLLKLSGIEIGDFDFSWNFKGPFSPGLLALLRSIDRHNSEVVDFYESTTDKMQFFSGQEAQIDALKEELEIDNHQDQHVQWIEILGSLAYISRAMLPGADFDKVNRRLIVEKPEYQDEPMNRHAWELLKKVNLLAVGALH